MEAFHSRLERDDVDALHQSTGPYWATELPQLRPAMLLPRLRPVSGAFPFDAPGVQYVHFARNAIYFLARQWGLGGHEVLMPAYFHGVELEALLAAGVRPRFFAVRSGMHVEPDDIVAAITRETRAVYLIHYAGLPGPAAAVKEICRARGLLFIEDCALSLLSRAGQTPLGSFGDAAVFCLYKTLPTPDGGAVVTNRGPLDIDGVKPKRLGAARQTAAAVLNHLERRGGAPVRRLARAVKAAGKAATRSRRVEWIDVGTQNFDVEDVHLLMSDVSRRIVATQDFDAIVAARRRNFLHLQSLLSEVTAPVFTGLPEGMCPLFYPFATEHKLELWRRLRREGVESVLFWMGGELGPPRGEFPDVDALRRTVLELPCHQDLTPDDMERLGGVVRKLARELGH